MKTEHEIIKEHFLRFYESEIKKAENEFIKKLKCGIKWDCIVIEFDGKGHFLGIGVKP